MSPASVDNAWGEIDHVMIFCDVGAPEADALIARGLHEGPRNSHPGQGTANRRFFFENTYLELVWVENFSEAQCPEVLPTQLWDRWRHRDAGQCPFGLVFRPGKRAARSAIRTWTYAPKYFPPGFSIEAATGIPANEPLLFYLPFARPTLVENLLPTATAPIIGPIVGVTVHLPQTEILSAALETLVATGVVTIEPAKEYFVDLLHTGNATGILDVRPDLPLRFVPARDARRARH